MTRRFLAWATRPQLSFLELIPITFTAAALRDGRWGLALAVWAVWIALRAGVWVRF